MDRLELYKDMYKREVERRNELNNELSIPIGLITLLATAGFFYLSNFDLKGLDLVTSAFGALLAAGLVFLILSIYFLLKSYNIFTKTEAYLYTPFPTELEAYYASYADYLRSEKVAEADIQTRTDAAFQEYLLRNYGDNATKNTSINDSRSTDLFKCKKNMARSLIALLIAFIPFSVNYFSKPEKVKKVEVVGKYSIPCK